MVVDEKVWFFIGGRLFVVGLDCIIFLGGLNVIVLLFNLYKFIKDGFCVVILIVRGFLEVRCYWCNCYFWLFVLFFYMIVFL